VGESLESEELLGDYLSQEEIGAACWVDGWWVVEVAGQILIAEVGVAGQGLLVEIGVANVAGQGLLEVVGVAVVGQRLFVEVGVAKVAGQGLVDVAKVVDQKLVAGVDE